MAQNEIITGQITKYSDNSPIKDLTVRIYKDDVEIAFVITDENGKYRISFDIQSNERVDLKVFLRDYILKTQTKIDPENRGRETVINYSLTLPGIVHGKIVNAKDEPVAYKTVRLYKKEFGVEKLLDEVKSSSEGIYYLYYSREKYENNLIVSLFENPDAEAINTTGLLVNVPETKEVNFLYKAEHFYGVSLYEKLIKGADETIKKAQDLSKITNDDVKILALQTKLSETDLKHLIRAKQIFKDLNNSAEYVSEQIIFALLKQGLSDKTTYLLTQKPSAYRKALTDSAKSNSIPFDTFEVEEELTKCVKNIQMWAVKNMSKSKEGPLSLNDIFLNTSIAALDEKKDMFLALYLANEKSDEQFWVEVQAEGFTQADIDRMRYNIDLMNFTEYNLEVFKKFVSDNTTKGAKTLKEIAQTVTEWEKFTITATEYPQKISGSNEIEKQINFATYLKNKLEERFPTEMLKTSICSSTTFSSETRSFLSDKQTDFDLSKDYLELYMKEKGKGFKNPATANELLAIQRLYDILPAHNLGKTLEQLWTKTDLRSASQIASMKKDAFDTLMSDLNITQTEAAQIWYNAHIRQAETMQLFAKYSGKLNKLNTTVLKDRQIKGSVTNETADYGALQQLLASPSCACETPRSVYGQAAYLVDNLMFLKGITYEEFVDESQQPIIKSLEDLLKLRRQDIYNLLLEPQNSETLIPYIDLVNEVLENAVDPGEDVVFQTENTEEIIAAYPEHVISSAYSTLRSAKKLRYNLPFDVHLEEARAWAKQLSYPLHKLIKVANIDKITWAIERLGFTPKGAGMLIAQNNSSTPSDIYLQNYESSEVIDSHNGGNVYFNSLLKDLDIDFDEAIQYLQTRYINVSDEKYKLFIQSVCSGSASPEINFEGLYFLTLYRFVKTTGFTITESDELRATFESNQTKLFSNQFFIHAAVVKELHEQTKVPVTTMLAWWQSRTSSSISVTDCYNRVYQNASLETTTLKKFKLNSSNALEGTLTFSNELELLASILKTKVSELQRFIDTEGFSSNATAKHLLWLAGAVAFCKATKITADEYYLLTGLIGQSPLSTAMVTATPEKTLQFIAYIETIRESGFSIQDLLYLLKNQGANQTELHPKNETLEAFFDVLTDALSAAKLRFQNSSTDKIDLLADVLSANLSKLLVITSVDSMPDDPAQLSATNGSIELSIERNKLLGIIKFTTNLTAGEQINFLQKQTKLFQVSNSEQN